MGTCAEFTVPQAEFQLGQTLGGEDVQVELLQLVPTGDQFVPYLWVEGDRQALGAFEETVQADDRVASFIVLDENRTSRLYRIKWQTVPNGLFGAVKTCNLVVERATRTTDEWEFRALCPQRENFSEFHQECKGQGIGITLKRLYDPTPSSEPPSTDLTPSQRETLETAHEAGYFEIPRETTLEELGDELDITRQSVSNRLRRGIETLIDDVL